jgi:flavodoxin
MGFKKVLIICESIHHENTLKIAKIISNELNADLKKPLEIKPNIILKYDLIGFGSGIYNDKHHNNILNLIDKLPNKTNKKSFIFSTSGVPVSILGEKFLKNYSNKAHLTIKEKLKNFEIIGEFISPGFNTNKFLKYFGGLNKKRPNKQDLESAKNFAITLKKSF